ncbi:hypothetical protein N9C85_01565 [Synechococcus sp. AH-224-I15]|nr:hypothetical protein [Synechococcus sp. AH-224-I15]
MTDDINYKAAAETLDHIIKELETRLEDHNLDERARRISTELLRVRRLERADFRAAEWGD